MRSSPYLSDAIKLKRLAWCINNINKSFENTVFCDETTVRVLEVPLYHWRPVCTYPDTVPHTTKYRLKVNVWGAISFKGPSKFEVDLFNT